MSLVILTCLRCGYDWPSRLPHPPKRCARCRSPYWNRPKRRRQEIGA